MNSEDQGRDTSLGSLRCHRSLGFSSFARRVFRACHGNKRYVRGAYQANARVHQGS